MVGDASVRDLARRSYVGVSEGDIVRNVAAVMAAEEGDDAVVLRGEEPVGHLAAVDVLALVAADEAERRVGEVMAEPAPAIDAHRSVADAAAVLNTERIGHLLVTNGSGGLLGVLSDRDVVAAAAMGPDSEPQPGPVGHSPRDEAAAGGAFSEQSVCETCGTFAPELASVNGQLCCLDCRQI